MKNISPEISVIIPTHHRCAALKQTLASLCRQTFPLNRIEVLVSADGCKDETANLVREFKAPFPLRVFDLPGNGAAAARNFGAAHATGSIFIFLDDDVETAPALFEAHVHSHRNKNQVVMGYLPPLFEEQPRSFFHVGLRSWWEDQFFEMRQSGHRFTYRDLLSGNFSIDAEFFRRVGGFDSGMKCREDFEFGFRLIKAGAQFSFAPKAWGFHHDNTCLARSLKRARAEGRADILISRRHPELRWSLPFFNFDQFNSRLQQSFHLLAFRHPAAGDFLARNFQHGLGLLERLCLRARWKENYSLLRRYWYWRGVAQEIGSRKALANFVQNTPPRIAAREIQLDLKSGLKNVEARLDEIRPDAAALGYGATWIGAMPSAPGAEPLCGRHLRPILARKFSNQLLAALALEHAFNPDAPHNFKNAEPRAEQPAELLYVD